MRLIHGDCLGVMPALEENSVDMILCDLPYGTTACKWDAVIPLPELWREYGRILRTHGAVVLTSSQPFTSTLVASNPEWFKYEWVWEKSSATGFFDVRHRPMKAHESILVFSRAGCSNGSKLPMRYNPQMSEGEAYSRKRRGRVGLAGSRSTPERADGGSNGNRWPRSVVYFPSATNSTHPTEKPVALMEYLIRTYTNEGDTVLDNCMGSGTTGVACLNTGRGFVGIENNGDYYRMAQHRILAGAA